MCRPFLSKRPFYRQNWMQCLKPDLHRDSSYIHLLMFPQSASSSSCLPVLLSPLTRTSSSITGTMIVWINSPEVYLNQCLNPVRYSRSKVISWWWYFLPFFRLLLPQPTESTASIDVFFFPVEWHHRHPPLDHHVCERRLKKRNIIVKFNWISPHLSRLD